MKKLIYSICLLIFISCSVKKSSLQHLFYNCLKSYNHEVNDIFIELSEKFTSDGKEPIKAQELIELISGIQTNGKIPDELDQSTLNLLIRQSSVFFYSDCIECIIAIENDISDQNLKRESRQFLEKIGQLNEFSISSLQPIIEATDEEVLNAYLPVFIYVAFCSIDTISISK